MASRLVTTRLLAGLDDIASSPINIEEDFWLISRLRKVISQSEAKYDHTQLFSLIFLTYIAGIHTKPNQQHQILHLLNKDDQFQTFWKGFSGKK